MKIFIYLILLTCLGLWMYSSSCSTSQIDNNHLNWNTAHIPDKKGVCWVGGDSINIHNYDELIEVGANWISQTPFGWQDGINNPIIHMRTERAWWGESDRGIIHTTKLAKERGIKTMLKPHLWIRNANGKWRSDIAMDSSEDWDSWFENYEILIMHYARLAETAGIESLCLGTELHLATSLYPNKWRAIIGKVRQVYSGELTYAANWYKEYEDISFWDELDYIGIQAYFPLSNNEEVELDELLFSWLKHKKAIKRISDRYNKRVIFTEIGYKNTTDSAIEPWTWPQNLEKDEVVRSDDTQIVLYQAMFESLFHETWVDGIFIWKWFHTTYKFDEFTKYFKAREARFDSLRRVRNRKERPKIYFTPQTTAAIEVLKQWYSIE